MGAWATASLFLVSVLSIEGGAIPQFQRPPESYPQEQVRATRQHGYLFYPRGRPVGVATQLHSASSLKPHGRLAPEDIYPPGKGARYGRNDFLGGSYPIFNFDDNFEPNLDTYRKKLETGPQTFPSQEANKRYSNDDPLSDDTAGYDDYRTSKATHILGPHQVETIQSEHYHKKVPAFDVSDFHHRAQDKHGEVHYHHHKHLHKHDHKQEHVHQHKNEHQHKHLHNQEHKHSHQSEHKHGHQHKHDHHQDHKHDHHHDHKHDHHQEHKHDHHHGHKHQHHSDSKHEHKHGHKHENKHDHEHKHKHQHSKHY